MIEPLEARIAPAAVFTYTDVDGDKVTITTSKGTDAQLAAIVTPFLVSEPGSLGPELQEIDFSADAATFAGTNLTVTAKRTAMGGDGLVNVGYIDAEGATDGAALDLGTITIRGDLGRIDAGDVATGTAAVKGLAVQSIGQWGTSTQTPGATLVSNIRGAIGSIKVTGNLTDALILLTGGADGKIGRVTIGGSLIGGGDDGSGQIFTDGAIGAVKIGGNIEGGTAGFNSARIRAGGTIASVTVGGSILGGAGFNVGVIFSSGAMGAVKIGGDIRGGGEGCGRIFSGSTLGPVTVGGSVIGGSHNDSGSIESIGAMGAVKIGGNIEGGDVDAAVGLADIGSIIGQRIASVFVGGSVIAGSETNGGQLARSGAITALDDLGPVTIKGSLIGNETARATIFARGQVAPTAAADVAIKSVTVGGRVEHAWIFGGVDATGVGTNGNAQIGAVRVGGDWIASSLVSGVTSSDGNIGDSNDAVIPGFGNDAIIAKIASITIKGQVTGLPGTSQTFGFVAQQIGSFKVAGTTIPLLAGASNDTFAAGKAQHVGPAFSGIPGDGFAVHVFEV